MSHSHFVNCRLKHLSEADCKEIAAVGTQVSDVNLSGNLLASLPVSFGHLLQHGLVQLDLSRNRLKEVPAAVTTLSRLQTLNLRSNLIEVLPPNCSQFWPDLEVLNLGENDLRPDALAALNAMPNLETLILDNNSLTHVRLSTLPCLLSLDLRKNRLAEFPELSGLPALLELSVRSNKLTVLSASCAVEISSVHKLDLGDNSLSDLSQFPSTSLTALRELDISYNKLVELPMLNGCSMLESLNLSNNFVSSVPAWFGSLRALRLLELSHNKLSLIPPNLSELMCAALDDLSVAHNLIEHIPPIPFNGPGFCLRRFDFKGNKITFEEVQDLIALEFAGKISLAHFYETVPQLIVHGVYLGSAESSRNVHALVKLGITHILNAAPARETVFSDRFKYLNLGMEDAEGRREKRKKKKKKEEEKEDSISQFFF